MSTFTIDDLEKQSGSYKKYGNMKIPVGDILYKLPPIPSFIEGQNQVRKDQKWKRTLFPNNWNTMSENQQLDFIKQDIIRRTVGHWFVVNGKPTYIPGDMYFYLNQYYMGADTPDGYPEYREADRLDFYFWDYCQADRNCYGMLYMAQRRSGKSEKGLASLMNRTMLEKEKHSGLQAPSTKDAKENLFQERIIRAWKRIPFELRPLHDSDAPKNMLRFSAPEKKGVRKNEKYATSLGSWIDFEQTEVGGYQGKKLFRYHLDEPGGLENMPLLEAWSTVKECLVLGSNINGKAYLATTIEQMTEKAGKPFSTLWEQSNFNKKDGNEQTASGLYRHFRRADSGLEGFIDEFGDDLMDENGFRKKQNIFIDNKIAGAPDGMKIKVRRQYARSEEDAFGMMGSDFWDEDVKLLLPELRNNLLNKDLPIKKMVFFQNGDQILTKADQHHPYAVSIFEEPKAGVKYFAGFDGAGSDKDTGGEKGSAVSVSIIKGADTGTNYQYALVAHFKFRPKKAEDAYLVTFLLCKYYNQWGNLKIGGERNIGQGQIVIPYFINRGGKEMLLKKPKVNGVYLNREEGTIYWFHRSGGNDTLDIQKYLGNQYLREYGGNIPFIEVIESLIEYGKSNQDSSDSFLAALLTMGDWKRVEKKKQVKQTMRWVNMGLKVDNHGATYEDWQQVNV